MFGRADLLERERSREMWGWVDGKSRFSKVKEKKGFWNWVEAIGEWTVVFEREGKETMRRRLFI